jgi:hypothetical protein
MTVTVKNCKKLYIIQNRNAWIPAPLSLETGPFAEMTESVNRQVIKRIDISSFNPLTFYQLYNRIEVVRCLYGRIAELALFFFVIVDSYIGVF